MLAFKTSSAEANVNSRRALIGGASWGRFQWDVFHAHFFNNSVVVILFDGKSGTFSKPSASLPPIHVLRCVHVPLLASPAFGVAGLGSLTECHTCLPHLLEWETSLCADTAASTSTLKEAAPRFCLASKMAHQQTCMRGTSLARRAAAQGLSWQSCPWLMFGQPNPTSTLTLTCGSVGLKSYSKCTCIVWNRMILLTCWIWLNVSSLCHWT